MRKEHLEEMSCSAGTVEPTASLALLLQAFLSHIVDYRDYSTATARAYRRDCHRLVEFLEQTGGPLDPGEIGPRDIRLFLSSLSHLSAASTRRTLYGVSSFFQYLVEMEIIPSNPAAPVDPPKAKRTIPDVPSREQCARMLDVCQDPTEAVVIGLLALAGLRRSELLGLDIADVAADLSSLRVEGKGGRQRVVPVSLRLRRLIEAHIAARTQADRAALLLNEAGNRMQTTTLYRCFKRVLARAGLGNSGITPHSLRHAFASELVRAGVDIATISELLGHSNIATTSIYLHSSAETKRDAVEKLSFVTDGVSGNCADDQGREVRADEN